MKIDVAKQIVDLLTENGSVRVPELGLFSFERKAAHFEAGKMKMNPPAIDIVFSEDEGDSEALANSIKKNYKVSKAEAREIVLKFSDKALNALMKLGKVRITGLGMLSKDKDDAVQFTANKSFTKQFFAGLPVVDTQIGEKSKTTSESAESVEKPTVIPPVALKEITPEEVEVPEIKTTEEVKEDPFALINKEASEKMELEESVTDETYKLEENKALEEVVAEITEAEKTEAIKTESIKTESIKTEPIKTEPEPVYYNDYNDDGYGKGWFVWPTILLLLFCLLTIFGLRKCAKTDPKPVAATEIAAEEVNNAEGEAQLSDGSLVEGETTNDLGEANSVEDSTEGGEITQEANTGSADDLDISEDNTLARDEDECIIVAGVFKAKRNADRMIRHIKTSGYIPYAQQHEDNIRVGIQFNCADADLVDFIRVIRRNISPNAWYLQPKLEVN